MTAIARDGVASDHLVYAWPFPLGPECDVMCREDEQVVMCPAWLVGDRLGPGQHRWRTPDPSRPVAAYFGLVAPVEVSFDMTTTFLLPSTGQPVRLRANGSMQVRCTDPGLLVAQFVGLPFDMVNDGVMRSVSRSVERMIARLLTRRVVMAGTPLAVTDAAMKPQIIEELIAYNPAAGAVFGIELTRMGYLTIAADDGTSPYFLRSADGSASPVNGNGHVPTGPITERGRPETPPPPATTPLPSVSGEIGSKITPRRSSVPPGEEFTGPRQPITPSSTSTASGEISSRPKSGQMPPLPKTDSSGGAQVATSSGEISAKPAPRRAGSVEVPGDEITSPSVIPAGSEDKTLPPGSPSPARGAIMGIGMSMVGASGVAGEIPTKVKPGGRVLVPGPNGLMQSATVRQLLGGYYELEVGSSGETIWVPLNGVVPE